MSQPSVLFTATLDQARDFELNHDLPDEDVFECSTMEPLVLSILYAILLDSADSVSLQAEFEEVRFLESEWTWTIPEQLRNLLATLPEPTLKDAFLRWAKEEDVRCEPDVAVWLGEGMRQVALRSVATNRPMFVYLSL